MWREATVRALLARAPGTDPQLLDPRPLVRVRAVYGRAIAITSSHILHEWVKAGQHHVRWDQRRQVHPVSADEWAGEELD